MWDRANDAPRGADHLSHDLACPRCSHPGHTYLACGDGCDCPPALMPGQYAA